MPDASEFDVGHTHTIVKESLAKPSWTPPRTPWTELHTHDFTDEIPQNWSPQNEKIFAGYLRTIFFDDHPTREETKESREIRGLTSASFASKMMLPVDRFSGGANGLVFLISVEYYNPCRVFAVMGHE